MFFDTFLIHVAKIYWIPTMCKASAVSKQVSSGCSPCSSAPSDCRAVAFLHWPASPVRGFDCFFLSDSQQRAIAHRRLQQEHSLPFGSDFPLQQDSLSRQASCNKVWHQETRVGCLAAELTPESGKPFSWRTGYSLFRSDSFLFWEVKEKQVETLTQIIHKSQGSSPILSSSLYICKHILIPLAHL